MRKGIIFSKSCFEICGENRDPFVRLPEKSNTVEVELALNLVFTNQCYARLIYHCTYLTFSFLTKVEISAFCLTLTANFRRSAVAVVCCVTSCRFPVALCKVSERDCHGGRRPLLVGCFSLSDMDMTQLSLSGAFLFEPIGKERSLQDQSSIMQGWKGVQCCCN